MLSVSECRCWNTSGDLRQQQSFIYETRFAAVKAIESEIFTLKCVEIIGCEAFQVGRQIDRLKIFT